MHNAAGLTFQSSFRRLGMVVLRKDWKKIFRMPWLHFYNICILSALPTEERFYLFICCLFKALPSGLQTRPLDTPKSLVALKANDGLISWISHLKKNHLRIWNIWIGKTETVFISHNIWWKINPNNPNSFIFKWLKYHFVRIIL